MGDEERVKHGGKRGAGLRVMVLGACWRLLDGSWRFLEVFGAF